MRSATLRLSARSPQIIRALHLRPIVSTPCHIASFTRRYSLSIDDFNKQKKPYVFGTPLATPRGVSVAQQKHQQHLQQQAQQQETEQDRQRWERNERFKAFGFGLAALLGIIATHQFVINYKYIKGYFVSKWNYDVDVSRVADMSDPSRNRQTPAALTEKVAETVDLAFIAAAKPTDEPGLYVFGAFAGKNLAMRVPGFDGVRLASVLVADDYIVAVDTAGGVHHLPKGASAPTKVSMPKASMVVRSGDGFYYVCGREILCGGRVEDNSQKGWLGGKSYPTEKLDTRALGRDKIAAVSAGSDHLLVVSQAGHLYETSTTPQPLNKGQFALPQYAPVGTAEPVPYHTLFPLTNMNNEIVVGAQTKTVRPRRFVAAAAGTLSNAAVDTAGNVWTWGDNSLCQCGREVLASQDIQPVPRVAFTLAELARFARYSLEDGGRNGSFSVDGLFSAGKTVYVKVGYHGASGAASQQVLLAFGGGLSGQLGGARYVQMSATPSVVKSLVGMKEYDEQQQRTHNIGLGDVACGDKHVFVTLGNVDQDVMAFGENIQGQLGNGRFGKTCKPVQLPPLLGPEDLAQPARQIARKVINQQRHRLQLAAGQAMAAGQNTSVVYFR